MNKLTVHSHLEVEVIYVLEGIFEYQVAMDRHNSKFVPSLPRLNSHDVNY